ncbi:MAG: 4-hydroxy-tetrahydrodipicolinate reductase [Planctomycetaceae bacterium]|jgi:4-hydroxy-tetrahydrodipicolinate reductase|nr:4-hydroxy-tetrahydrodipicolinate reductase [Planctomycetaceae bacterium]
MPKCSIAVHGAAGRMGQRLVTLISQDEDLTLSAAIDVSQHPKIGTDVGVIVGIGSVGIVLSDTFSNSNKADAVIDFSNASAMEKILAACVSLNTPLVLATTGLSSAQEKQIHNAAKAIPILWSPNTGMAVNIAFKLAQTAAKSLAGQNADVEILERHHHHKVDAPSGTALKFGEIIAREMGQNQSTHGRKGIVGERPGDEIGYHAIRVGDNPGEHTIVFGMLGELIEITVRVTNRDCYAYGAIAAAKYIIGCSAGLYSMKDVLGL